MDTEKNEASPPSTPSSNLNPSVDVETEKECLKSPIPKKVTHTKRAVSEEEGRDSTSSADKKSRAKKRNLGSEGAMQVESEKGTQSDYASDNVREEVALKSMKKRKTPKATSGPKGNWSKEEDKLILNLKKEGMGWQDITDSVRAAGNSEAGRSLTAVRLRYQKVLKDRDVEITFEELALLKQAEIDVEKSEKYRFVAVRYKELSGGKELSKGICQKLARKGGLIVTKDMGESSKE